MPTTTPEEFFSSIREWQWIKHLILSTYLLVWGMKVGSTAREIFVVDAFAGAGTYTMPNGETRDGSPVIAARRARQYRASRPTSKMTVICIERDPIIYKQLQQRMAEFGDFAKTMPGDFHDHLGDILRIIGDAPAVILLDPIGLKAITADRCRELLQRAGKTDLFVIVHFRIVHGAGGQLLADATPNSHIAGSKTTVKNVDDFFGTREWRRIAVDPTLERLDKEKAWLQLYFDSVLGNRFRLKSAYDVKPELDGAVKYWLVHACNSDHAYWLMNDSIVKVDQLLLQRKYDHPGELPGIGEQVLGSALAHSARQRMEELRGDVVRSLEQAGREMTFHDLTWSLAPFHFGKVTQGAYAKAVKQLVKQKRVRREHRLAAALDPSEVVSLARPSDTEQSGGVQMREQQLRLFG